MLTKAEYLRSLKTVAFDRKKALMLFVLTVFLSLLGHIAFYVYATFSYSQALYESSSVVKKYLDDATQIFVRPESEDFILHKDYVNFPAAKTYGAQYRQMKSQVEFDKVKAQIKYINKELTSIRFVSDEPHKTTKLQ